MENKPKAFGRAKKLYALMRSSELTEGASADVSIPEERQSLLDGHQSVPEGRQSIPEERQSVPTFSGALSFKNLSGGCGRSARLLQGIGPEILSSVETETPKPQGSGRGLFLAQIRKQHASGELVLSDPSGRSSVPTIKEKSIEKDFENVKISNEGTKNKEEEGEKVPLYVNFVTLTVDSGKGIFEYEVSFVPEIEYVAFRYLLINQHFHPKKGIRCYDGSGKLYMPEKTKHNKITVKGYLPTDNSQVTINIIYKKQLEPKDCSQLYNILFHNIAKVLNLARVGKQHYDYQIGIKIPQHKLEIWPGYVTSIEEFEGGIHLCCDIRHRVLRTDTVYDILGDFAKLELKAVREKVSKELIGQCVLTRYNNSLYRIDDIDWERTPMSTFKLKSGEKITFIEYYKKQYHLDIKDLKQPLLINKPKRNKKGERPPLICLIPELCHTTGLTDTVRKDMKVMKEIAACTRVSPSQRQYALQSYITNVRSNPRAQEMLKDWGLNIAPDPVLMDGRILPPENIYLKNNQIVSSEPNAQWGKHLRNYGVLRSVDLTDWVFIYPGKYRVMANKFSSMLQRVGPGLGCIINEPLQVCLPDDRIDSYITGIKSNVTKETQIVMCLCPTSRDDRYSAIKKLCCREIPVPSQVLISNTISNEIRMRPIAQSIALQMNNKIGGAAWGISVPLKNTMVCGIDTYHDTRKMNSSVGAFVASLDDKFSRWFSQSCFQEAKLELIDGIIHCFVSALKKYYCLNGVYPDRIIIFRDGVSDGQLNTVLHHEIRQFLLISRRFPEKLVPAITFIVVQKRIAAKFFPKSNSSDNVQNPRPGCVVDYKITRRNWNDFFLVSQYVTSGTVSPSHYIILYDNSNLKPYIQQRITYKFCHIYYNWTGSIRVPAPCQYAHKLAYLVGQNIKGLPDITLEDKLFYL